MRYAGSNPQPTERPRQAEARFGEVSTPWDQRGLPVGMHRAENVTDQIRCGPSPPRYPASVRFFLLSSFSLPPALSERTKATEHVDGATRWLLYSLALHIDILLARYARSDQWPIDREYAHLPSAERAQIPSAPFDLPSLSVLFLLSFLPFRQSRACSTAGPVIWRHRIPLVRVIRAPGTCCLAALRASALGLWPPLPSTT